jgi:lipoprotein-anchoring transpeptidase ErfK/SrfK
MSVRLGALLAISVLAAACSHREPPGRRSDLATTIDFSVPTAEPSPRPASAPSAAPEAAPRRVQREPSPDSRIGSIAMRTWIYDQPDNRARKLGYLRAGAVVDRSPDPVGTKGCEGGWYRVPPRGHVCVGKGATLDLTHPIVQAASGAPRRGQPLPYDYAMSGTEPPHLYFRLPSVADQQRVEGQRRAGAALPPALAKLPVSEVPEFLLSGRDLPQPYGSDKNLSYSVHRGRARANSAFGFSTLFEWTDRRFGLTTELDLVALDQTKPAVYSQVRGIELVSGGRPAFVLASGTRAYVPSGATFKPAQGIPGRTGFELTGKEHGGASGLLETTAGVWLPAPALVVGELRKDRASHAERGKKWISVSIEKQLLIAYEGERPVYAALVSTGRGGMGDPETSFATLRGTFMIRAKHVSGTMDGEEGSDEAFDLRDVPYIQYFHEGFALHAAYWHDEFGKPRSHGCVNLSPTDAAHLFEWTDPKVPAEWHGATSPQGGTLVYVHK